MQPARIILLCMALVALTSAAAAAPDEERLGKAAGYPIGTRTAGSMTRACGSDRSAISTSCCPTTPWQKAASPLPLPAAADIPKFEYRFEDRTYTLDDFLSAPARHRPAADQGRRDSAGALSIRSHAGRIASFRIRWRNPLSASRSGWHLPKARLLRWTTRSPNTCRSLPAVPMGRRRSGTS